MELQDLTEKQLDRIYRRIYNSLYNSDGSRYGWDWTTLHSTYPAKYHLIRSVLWACEQARGQKLLNLAKQCRALIERAEFAGLEIYDGNVVDLIVNRTSYSSRFPISTADIRAALVVAGYGSRFPISTAKESKYDN